MALPQQRYALDSSKNYPFVQSTEEHQRLNVQAAAINDAMFNEISHAPMESPTKILDVGCGTGIQTVLLAKLYPQATVIGIDPNAVPDNHEKPENVKYILGKIEDLTGDHALLQWETFDLVYQRYLIFGITNWTKHIELLRSLLRPKGWIEIQEAANIDVYDENNEIVSSTWRFPAVIERDAAARGIDWRIAEKLPAILPDAGFENVRSKSFPHPYRPGWEVRPETHRLGEYASWAVPPMFEMLIRRAGRAELGEDRDELLQEVHEKMLQGPIGLHWKIYVTVGRKT